MFDSNASKIVMRCSSCRCVLESQRSDCEWTERKIRYHDQALGYMRETGERMTLEQQMERLARGQIVYKVDNEAVKV